MEDDAVAAYQIGEVAEMIGLSHRTIRHYEEVGLVPPSGRTSGGFRLYNDLDVDRLRLIMQMKPLGFTLDEMRELLDLQERVAAAAQPTDLDLELLEAFARIADQRCDKLRRQLRQVENLSTVLRDQVRDAGTSRAQTDEAIRLPARAVQDEPS